MMNLFIESIEGGTYLVAFDDGESRQYIRDNHSRPKSFHCISEIKSHFSGKQFDKVWLKQNNYRNVGWNNIIKLFEKVYELQQKEIVKSLSLEELFLEADRIGNKYLNSQEINQRNQKIAQELNVIADIIDSQYPDQTVEIVDYSQ